MTIRHYKKAYWIGRDSFGKMIYDGDTVEVWLPWETGTPHQSKVFWNRMDGAFIESHPAHHGLIYGKVHHRDLRSYLNTKPVPIWSYEEDEDGVITGYKQGYVKKVKSFYTE